MTTAPQGDTEPGLQVYLSLSTRNSSFGTPFFARLLELSAQRTSNLTVRPVFADSTIPSVSCTNLSP